MNRSLRAPLTLVAVVLLLGVMLAAGPAPRVALAAADAATCAPRSGSASISGTVTGPGSVPLSYVSVTAYTTYGLFAGSAITNLTGAYQITGLIGGSYLLKFEPQSDVHHVEWYHNQPSALAATPVNVAAGAAVTGVDAELAVGARFSGTVTGQGGGPLSGIQVTVYDAQGLSVARATTNAAGAYTTQPGLPSGTYRVGFGHGQGFLGGYYGGATLAATLAEATPLTVAAPDVRSGVNATLPPGVTIRGTVTRADNGMPLRGFYVSASGPGGFFTTITDGDGIYELRSLGSGRYTLRAAPPDKSSNLVVAEQTVEVTAPDTITDVDFALAGGATLSGKVTGPGGAPLENITVFVRNVEGSYQEYVYTDASGNYEAKGLPAGDYLVHFRPSNYIPERYNNRPENGQSDLIAVPAQGTVTGIDAELALGSSVRGRVTDKATGLPIEGVFVEVLDLNGSRVETDFTKADGTYQTPETLPSGQYLVRFNANSNYASCTYVSAYYGGALRQEDAARVTVSAPTPAVAIDAELTRGSILFGRLTDQSTGAPITSGAVTVFDAQGRVVNNGIVTFLGGWYTTTGLPSGSYKLYFRDRDEAYIDEYYNDALSFAQATPVVVSAPTDRTGLDVALAKGAAIAGRVTAGDTGQPFIDGYVGVYNSAGEEVGYGSIAADGRYEVLTGLPSGSYYVAVVPYGAAGALAAAPAQGGQRPGYAVSFYGRSVTRGAADQVTVSAPDRRTGVDIVMLRASWMPMLRR